MNVAPRENLPIGLCQSFKAFALLFGKFHGRTCDGVRVEWDASDLTTPGGVRVEVKSAAYCQTWAQRRLSSIGFDIAPKWPDTIPENDRVEKARRAADVYVFCLLHHQEKTSVEPMKLEQWMFWVLSTRVLDERVPYQKRIALSSLLKLDPAETAYGGLRECVARAAAP